MSSILNDSNCQSILRANAGSFTDDLRMLGAMDSPFTPPPFAKGDCVMIRGLATTKFNYLLGKLGNFYKDAGPEGRWAVFLLHDPADPIRVKPEFLTWVCDKKTYNKGGVVCDRSYLFTALLNFAGTQHIYPRFNLSEMASAICASYADSGFEFEDRTEQLEQLQASGRCNSMDALCFFLDCGTEAMDANGKKGIFVRRTPANSAFFCANSVSSAMVNPGGVCQDRTNDFIFYVNDDFIQAQRGSDMTEKQFRHSIEELVRKHVVGEQIICSICQDAVDAHMDNFTSDCSHTFHIKCFQTWAEQNPVNDAIIKLGIPNTYIETPCPTCRQVVQTHFELKSVYMTPNKQAAVDAIDRMSHGRAKVELV
jgi:hypothetical protein